MAAKSTGRKRAKSKGAPAKKAKPRRAVRLDAQEGFVRNREVSEPGHRNKGTKRHATSPGDGQLSALLDGPRDQWLGLMNRCVQAYMELPMRLTRCRSPFELWTEQMRFGQAVITDCQTMAQRALAEWGKTGGGAPLGFSRAPKRRAARKS